jgi:hypothetical protein
MGEMRSPLSENWIGQSLTGYCNETADTSGCRTWIPVPPNGFSIFKRKGFKKIAVLDANHLP